MQITLTYAVLPAPGIIEYAATNLPTCSFLTIKCSDRIDWIGSGKTNAVDPIGSDRKVANLDQDSSNTASSRHRLQLGDMFLTK